MILHIKFIVSYALWCNRFDIASHYAIFITSIGLLCDSLLFCSHAVYRFFFAFIWFVICIYVKFENIREFSWSHDISSFIPSIPSDSLILFEYITWSTCHVDIVTLAVGEGSHIEWRFAPRGRPNVARRKIEINFPSGGELPH